MSSDVEHRVYELLGRPTHSPYGNPIPGLHVFDPGAVEPAAGDEHNLASSTVRGAVTVGRICESVQTDAALLERLHAAGIDPGAKVHVEQDGDTVTITHDGAELRLPSSVASRVFVTA